MIYAELNDVIYRAKDDYFFSQKLINGKWIPSWDSAKVRSQGMVIGEGEARQMAGSQWPNDKEPA
jgi:hypothetical protein